MHGKTQASAATQSAAVPEAVAYRFIGVLSWGRDY